MFGAPSSVTEEVKEFNDDYLVFEENWETVQTFLRLGSQWNTGIKGATGLNYQSVESYFRILGLKNKKNVFDGLQIMEFEALRIFEEERAKDGNRK